MQLLQMAHAFYYGRVSEYEIFLPFGPVPYLFIGLEDRVNLNASTFSVFCASLWLTINLDMSFPILIQK